MKKKLLKKLMVLALSAVTAFSAVPAATVTAAGNPYSYNTGCGSRWLIRDPLHTLCMAVRV